MIQVVGLAVRAWFVGLTTAAVFVSPAEMALRGVTTEPFFDTLAQRLLGFVVMIPVSFLMSMTFGVVLSAPLFLLGTLAALLCPRLVVRYPWAMTALATVCTVVIVAGLSAVTRDNEWAQTHGFVEKFVHLALSRDTLLFAIPVAVGSYYFCTRLAKAGQRIADPATTGAQV